MAPAGSVINAELGAEHRSYTLAGILPPFLSQTRRVDHRPGQQIDITDETIRHLLAQRCQTLVAQMAPQRGDGLIVLALGILALRSVIFVGFEKILEMIRIRLLFLLVDLGQRMVELPGRLHTLRGGLGEDRTFLSRRNLPADLTQTLVKLKPFLLLFGNTSFLLLEGILRLGALLLEALLHQRNARILDAPAGLRFVIHEVLRELGYIAGAVLRRRDEPAEAGLLAQIGDVLHQLLRLVEVGVTLLPSGLYQPRFYFLIRLVDLAIHLTGQYPHLRTAHFGHPTAEAAGGALDFIGRSSLKRIHLLVRLGSLIDESLHLRLQKEHLNVRFALLKQHIVPFGNGVVVAEALAVFTIELFDLRLFLLLRAVELLEAFQGRVDLEARLDHLRTALFLDLHALFGFGGSSLLRVGITIPQDDQTRDDGRKPQRQRRHERRGRSRRDAQRRGQPSIGRRQQVLHLDDRHEPEGGIFVQGIHHLLQAHRDGQHALHACLNLDEVLVLRREGAHDARSHREGPGNAARTAYQALKPGIVVRENLRLRAQVAQRILQQCGTLCHRLVLLRVLAPLEAHLRHRSLKLPQLHRKPAGRRRVLFVLAAKSVQHGFVLFERTRTGFDLRAHLRLRRARPQPVVLTPQVFQALFDVAYLFALRRDALRDALRNPLDTISERLGRLPGGIEAAGELVAHQKFYFNGFRHAVYLFS